MREYKDLFIWENLQNIKILENYLHTIKEYRKSCEENKRSKTDSLRENLMMDSEQIENLLLMAGVLPVTSYGAPALGYRTMNIVYSLPFFIQTSDNPLNRGNDQLNQIYDYYNRAIGVYKRNQFRSLINIINPFLYIRMLSNLLLEPLFYLFSVSKEQQESGIWRILRLILNVLAYIASIWVLIEKFNIDKLIETFIN